jgi:glycosyltransferase involved in cell wall biosynthesis
VKLVWIAQDLHIGGGQRVICELSGEIARRGHRVEIIYPRGRGGFPPPPGVTERPCGWEFDSSLLSLLVNFPATIAAAPLCDWILCSMPVSALAGYLAGKLRGARVLYYIMNDERILFDDRTLMKSDLLLDLYHRFTDRMHRLPVEFAVNSRWTASRVRGGAEADLPVIHHGVDPARFSPAGDVMERGDRFVIAVIGRRHRWKGLDDLTEALNRLKSSGEAPPFELWIITQDDLQPSADFHYKIIKPTGDDDIARAYRTADLAVHPSWFEGFGLPPLEAMACGTPAVITDSGGVMEYARDGVNCLLTPVHDPDALAQAILQAMQDASLRRRLREEGLKTAAEFTWRRAADQLEAILNKPL